MNEPASSLAVAAAASANAAGAASRRRVAAHVRALLLAIVLVVEGAEAIPGKPLNEQQLSRPEGLRVVTWIERALAAVGSRPGQEAIGQRLLAGSAAIVALRHALLLPFEPLFHYTGTGQRWALFVSARRECFRIRVAAGSDASYQNLYRAQDIDEAALGPLLTYRRTRGLYDAGSQSSPSAAYAGLAKLIADRVFEQRPEVARVRVWMERLYIAAPEAALKSLGAEYEVVQERVQP
jgi:hypothetical protein